MDGAVDGGLELVERLPLSQCPQFLHKVIDGLCGRAQPRFQDYGVIWSLREWLEVLENTTAFIKTSVGKDGSSDEVVSVLVPINSKLL
ncbi:unnamed protein product [Ranitomeya imitator]|uniref:COMMD8 helical N-terminal domain-containing protein n=1 Tax=Ranitomeya imitator TaxID=111125 RepID=A0ABN9M1W2_9NEOB|nr:unnamed protein product [Ranitomeya imitator]